MSFDPTTASASEIAAAVSSRSISARDIAATFCATIAASEPTIHALLHHDADAVLTQADAVDHSDQLRNAPLAGVPIVIKDNMQVSGMPLTCASKILGNYRSTFTATAVQRLLDAGAVVIGKSNLDEFAMGSSCEYSAFGPTFNPWDPSKVPGGSSGGSAAAVAAGFAPLALGSETGGSVRQPAALCGTVGFKPTYGRVSRFGLVAFASSLDQIGPFARSVSDTALCLALMAGNDPHDNTSLPTPSWAGKPGALAKRDLKGLRVGVVPEHFGQGIDSEVSKIVKASIDELRERGAEIVELAMPVSAYSVQVYYVIATSEASSNLSRFDGVRYGHRDSFDGNVIDLYQRTRGAGFGTEVKRRIMLGTYALSAGYQDAYYKRAIAAQDAMRREFADCFAKCDVILGPTSPTPAFPIGANTGDPLAMYLCDLYTIGANLAGVPAISVPVGFTDAGLPVGMQLQGPHGSDWQLLEIAAAVESAVGTGPRLAPAATIGR